MLGVSTYYYFEALQDNKNAVRFVAISSEGSYTGEKRQRASSFGCGLAASQVHPMRLWRACLRGRKFLIDSEDTIYSCPEPPCGVGKNGTEIC